MSSAGVKIPWFEPLLSAADVAAVTRCVESGFVNEGPQNREFERLLAGYFGVPHVVTTPNCTLAISLSLKTLGVGHGDSVLVPDVTFIGTASAVAMIGAEPILVDVNPHTFCMDPEDAARRLRPNTKAIVPVHLNGRSADMKALRDLARRKGLSLVEDTAESVASRNAEGFLGTQSDAGCFSLAPTKIITSGQGGFVLSRRQDVRDGIVRLKDHGRLSRASDLHEFRGCNFKVTDMQAALAISQWRELPRRMARACEIDARYRAGLMTVKEIIFTDRPQHGGYLMWPDFKTARRDELVAHLRQQGIILRPFWPALHTQPSYHSTDTYPGATEASREACWLPCSPGITDAQVDEVIAAVRKFFGG